MWPKNWSKSAIIENMAIHYIKKYCSSDIISVKFYSSRTIRQVINKQQYIQIFKPLYLQVSVNFVNNNETKTK